MYNAEQWVSNWTLSVHSVFDVEIDLWKWFRMSKQKGNPSNLSALHEKGRINIDHDDDNCSHYWQG